MTEFDLIRALASRFPLPRGLVGIGDDCAVIPGGCGSVLPEIPGQAGNDASFVVPSHSSVMHSSTGHPSDHSSVIPDLIGDPCDLLVTTDLLAEGVHFLADSISPYDLGYKSAAVNISDIAAMGGTPRHAFLSLALPKDITDGVRHARPDRPSLPTGDASSAIPTGAQRSGGISPWLDAFFDGFADACRKWGVTLLGGDTSASKGGIFINVTLTGSCPHGSAVLRSGAQVGDLICVTGSLGDSAAGLRLLQEDAADFRYSSAPLRSGRNDKEMPEQVGHDEAGGHEEEAFEMANRVGHDEWSCHLCHFDRSAAERRNLASPDEEYFLRRHCHPEPRIAEGQALRECPGVHAMMDVSDGIASDLPHILEASGVGATVDVASLPLSPSLRRLCASRGWDPVDLALCGGEDYELLFTLAPNALPPVACTVIGTITAAPEPVGTGNAASDIASSGTTSAPIRWIGGKDSYDGFRHF